ncbi:MAG: leucyl aminopeptidase [Streptosporangiaceae bacterium]
MTNDLQTTQASAREVQADAVIIGITQGSAGPLLAAGAQDVDAALDGGLAATLAVLGATGAPGEITRIASGGTLKAPLIVATGLGQEPDSEALRRGAGAAVRSLAGKAAQVAIALPIGDAAQAEAIALGALLGRYAFTRYRASERGRQPELTLLTAGQPDASEAVRRAQVLADAVCLVRDLVNTSPADLYPETLAAAARQVAADSGLDIEVLDEKELADGGYGGLIGVGQGSARPPRLVRLSYTRPGATRTVAFAGKGITFDSGGLSLKPSKAMETMKSDMGGAAAVLGALQAVAALGPEVNVIGYLAIAENMPGGQAQRPSDVITIYGGKTVEVLNTDAEGRLVLADALARSAQDEPDLVVDVATLTGAQLVALGTRVSGVMGSDARTADAVVDAAGRAGEQAWAMPLPEELRKGLDSAVADIANVSGDRNGGMLVAGLFLREFAPKGVRWAHVDIAGPAFNEGEPYGYTPKGGTGAAVRMLVQIALDAADGQL